MTKNNSEYLRKKYAIRTKILKDEVKLSLKAALPLIGPDCAYHLYSQDSFSAKSPIKKNVKRCPWVSDDPVYIRYHDFEWGVPVHDDRLLFEYLNLEGAQAGLSWITVLKKRAHYRKVFDRFDAKRIIKYDKKKVETLLKDPGIIRNRLKVEAVIQNAKAYLAVKKEFGIFDAFIWRFVDHKPVKNKFKGMKDLPARTEASDKMSLELKRKGFKFVGSTICYAFMQAVGMVNDHTTDCFRHKAV